VRRHLREKRLLLVLDNFEHLLDAAAEVAGLIESCPTLVVLATNRSPARRGEQEYPVPPLALPSSTLNPSESDVLRTPSGRLFLQRIRAVSPGFAITEGNAGDVAAIWWRLAGLPLALELAAARRGSWNRQRSWRDWTGPSRPVGLAISPRGRGRCAVPSTGATTC